MIEQLLSSLGINSNEINTYLSLAELGKSTASIIAKRLQSPRSTIYTALDGLLKRGIISIEQEHEVNYYIANKPESLVRMITIEKKASEELLKQKMNLATEAIPLLTPYFKNENYSVPKLRFFEGTTNVQSMLYDHFKTWQESISKIDYTWWGYQDHEFVETYREWLDFYWSSMDKDEKIYLLSNRSETEKKLKNHVSRRIIKAIPKKFQFSSTVWVLGDFVITIMTRQKPHYAFILQDAVFAANQRLTFQLLWELL